MGYHHNTIFLWSEITPRNFFYRGAIDYVPDGDISGDVILYAVLTRTANTGSHTRVYKSTDGGDTWVTKFTVVPPEGTNVVLHCPYDSNDGGHLLWGTNEGTWQSTDSGVSRTQLQPVLGAIAFSTRHGVGTWTNDKQRIVFWDEISFALYVSTNGGTSWSLKNTAGVVGDDICAAGGFPNAKEQYYLVTNKGVYVSIDDNGVEKVQGRNVVGGAV